MELQQELDQLQAMLKEGQIDSDYIPSTEIVESVLHIAVTPGGPALLKQAVAVLREAGEFREQLRNMGIGRIVDPMKATYDTLLHVGKHFKEQEAP